MSDRFWGQVDRVEDGCWIWQGSVSHGYGQFRPGGRGTRNLRAHRYALSTVMVVPDEAHVLHSCDQPLCVNPSHLRLGDHAQNMRDMAQRERSRTTKLTANDVLSLRRDAEGGATHAALALRYGVSKSNVQAIVARLTWRHLA